ncbi:MAG: TBC domain-containing protein, partial [Methanobacteriota archaeon]
MPQYDAAAVNAAIASVGLDLPNQRVVRMDAERTRTDQAEFKDAAMLQRVQRLLTYYCKCGYAGPAAVATGCSLPSPSASACAAPSGGVSTRSASRRVEGVTYKQGLNEILAIFLHLGPHVGALDDACIMALLSAFVARFAPRILASSDEEFTSLQCCFQLYRLALQYHDPELSGIFDRSELTPELYTTPWFLTLFSRANAADAVIALWDYLIVASASPGPAFFHSFVVAFIVHHKLAIRNAANSPQLAPELPLIVVRLPLPSAEEMRDLCESAAAMFLDTPLSFRKQVHNVCFSGGKGITDGAGTRHFACVLYRRRLD